MANQLKDKMQYAWWILLARRGFSVWMLIKAVVLPIANPIAGRLFAEYEIKKLLTAGVMVNAIVIATLSQGRSLIVWYVVGAIIVFAAAFIYVIPSVILLTRWLKENLGFSIGMAIAFSAVSWFLFNPAVGSLTSSNGLGFAYIAVAIVVVAITLPVAVLLVKYRPADTGLTSLGAKQALAGTVSVDQSGVSIKAAFRGPAFYFLFMFALFISCIGAISPHIGSYIMDLGLGMSFAAIIASILMASAAFGKNLLGILNDKVGVKNSTIIYSIITVGGIILLSNTGKNIILAGTAIALVGIGMSLITVEPRTITDKIFGKKHYAEIHGWIELAASVGLAIFITVLGCVYDVTHSYVVGCNVLAFMAVLALAFGLPGMRAGQKLQMKESREIT